MPMDWTRFNQLVALSESGKVHEAISGLKQLAESAQDDQDKAGVLTVLGACEKDADQLDEAHKTLAEARALANEDSWVHPRALLIDARIDVRRRRWGDALHKLDEILQRYPTMLTQNETDDLPELIDRYRGMALYKVGRLGEARILLERAAATEHDKPGALYYLGRCCYDIGDLECAKDSLCRSLTLDLDPDYQPMAHYVLGLSHHWTGQSARAVSEFEWCLQHDERGLVEKRNVLTALIAALKTLRMDDVADRYTKELRALL